MTRALLTALLLVAGCATPQKARQGEPPEPELKGHASPAQFHRAMGRTLLQTRQYTRAIPHIQRLLRADEKDADARVLMARVHLGLGLYRQAEAELTRAIQLQPKLAEAHSHLGVVLDSLGDHPRAELSHRQAIVLDVSVASYHNNLGFCLFLQKRYGTAVESFLAALALNPSLAKIHNNLGFAYAKSGNLRAARKHFELAGGDATADNNMGYVHEDRGELSAAYDYYLKAFRGDPKLRPARHNLTRVCKRLGRPFPAGVAEPPPGGHNAKEVVR